MHSARGATRAGREAPAGVAAVVPVEAELRARLVPEVHLVLLSVLDELESLSAALIAPWLDVVGTILRNAARYFRIDLEGIRREVRLLGRCLLRRSCPPEVPRKSKCRYDTPRKHMSLFK